MRSLLRSKIHHATVTEANVDYVGSITIDRELIDAVGLWVGEKVLVVSSTTGARLETYVIEGEAGSGVIGINGPAAHLINAGERVIIMGFEITEKPVKPKIVLCDKTNHIAEYLDERAGMVVG
jgi:aspartate 1-decarboxylase